MLRLQILMCTLAAGLVERIQKTSSAGIRKFHDSRGDVPGWVMITLMSALLVAALLAIAGPRLQELFNQAIDRVSGLG
ncbi:hypothetical protein AUR04nite_25110 [Glutamicibacter uratoxydans]|uniref:Uncharacterized protein n=2 Tax=Glutamicibacter uratoxydans TaxID=43667 RepID=A0A4Y4DNT7_GLUUR|nr:hypothetical protein [Glutamicibacter uratoxydans]GED06979.1 hypothetical protein AUR04nite_25110 [Glutamicibacter uratoxydans]